ncbi:MULTISPECIES: hypothetical protein [unclassified Janthinobacterium]|uniref:hypothetical protein n=1 Tax=unclassified Janthinobacterium TaxID=2610881 RepID=UPI001607C227|nr:MULTISPECIES: hypothetical protein [unclassified Janthinobacterium]MBB5369327.1 hypothetical protein [Janthinobacterium sp. K2C7]MBB5381137.1 hypothetical protein [Janthinobacterium sp. K2Li3]MBB5387710.1 hypothetical protein [Janthinobacterium sp. K2E3]
MKVRMVMMRKLGLEIPRRMLSDRYTVTYRGMLTIMDVTDQGLRRPVKVARLTQGARDGYELIDPHILWANDGRFTLSGFERVRNDAGELVSYDQSWLCSIENYADNVSDEEVGFRKTMGEGTLFYLTYVAFFNLLQSVYFVGRQIASMVKIF